MLYNSWGYRVKEPSRRVFFEREPNLDDNFSDAWRELDTGKVWWTAKGAPPPKGEYA